MSDVNNTQHLTDGRKARKRWYNHLLLFVVVLLLFWIFDGSTWTIFNLNPVGEWALANIPLGQLIPIYESEHFNWLTAVWGIILITHGIVSFFFRPKSSKQK